MISSICGSFILRFNYLCNTIERMAKLIATDLDGTLFYPKRRVRMISNKSLKFLHNFIDEGNHVVLVSGRNQEYCHKVLRKINRPVDIIGCNSSFIIHDGNLIKETFFDGEKLAKILEEIKSKYNPKAIMIMTGDKNFISKRSVTDAWYTFGYKIWYFFQGVYREKFFISDQKFDAAVKSGKVYKVMIMFGVNKKAKLRALKANKEIRETYPNDLEASWSEQMIELTPFDCSKASGLKYYANYLMINHNDIFVVGDSGNDISMFNEFYENSYCIERAPLSVSKHANHVIKHFWELEKYIAKKGSY